MEDKRSGKIRKKRTYYAQVSNVALRDETMSLKAKGLLALIESYLSLDNFVLYKDFLMSKSLDGETAFRGAWKELKEHGYLIQYKLKDNDTKHFYYEYEICDNPQVENQHMATENTQVHTPQVENPQVAFKHLDKPLVDNLSCSSSTRPEPPPYNNNVLNNNLYINTIRTNIDYDPVFVSSATGKTLIKSWIYRRGSKTGNSLPKRNRNTERQHKRQSKTPKRKSPSCSRPNKSL